MLYVFVCVFLSFFISVLFFMVISDIFYCYCCFLFKYSFVLFVVIFIVYFVLSLHYLCCSYPIGGAWQSEATLPQPRGHAAFRADIACPPPPTQAFDLIKQLQNAPQADGTRGPVPPEPGCGRTAGLRRGVASGEGGGAGVRGNARTAPLVRGCGGTRRWSLAPGVV